MDKQLPSDPAAVIKILNNPKSFWKLGLETIQELETQEGILASSRQEIYGCIFGRDSLITALKLLRAYEITKNPYFLGVVKKVLKTLTALQGKDINIESGEEPGKCIHEFRTSHYEHLTKSAEHPWYLYPDNIMRNFDSVDATPLLLITIYRYFQKSGDKKFLTAVLPNVELALAWLLKFADSNDDGFIDYYRNPARKFGGLISQNWMDSEESVFFESGEKVAFPVAPVEVQAYSYLALKLWSRFYRQSNAERAEELRLKAERLKILFNRHFILQKADSFSLAFALDGLQRPLVSVRSSMGHVLWASLNEHDDGIKDSILGEQYVPLLVNRLLQDDLFEPRAGVRTLSAKSAKFAPNSYHNGSIWPHDNSMIAEGLELWGFNREATKIRKAMFQALNFFGTPIELFVYQNGQYEEYCSATGQRACKKQAWSAASLLTASLSLQNEQS